MNDTDTSTNPGARFRRAAPALACLAAWALLGLLACSQEPAGVTLLTPDQLLSAPPSNALILDVRTPEEFAGGHVPGARNIPYDQLPNRLGELGDDRDRNLVVYCESGRRAGKAESTLLAAGFTSLHHLEGDMKAWRDAGRPTEAEGAP